MFLFCYKPKKPPSLEALKLNTSLSSVLQPNRVRLLATSNLRLGNFFYALGALDVGLLLPTFLP